MIIKSYVGDTVAEALKMIRSELGPKAVVLKTRAIPAMQSETGRRQVEITACLEKPTVGALDASFRNEQSEKRALKNLSAKPVETFTPSRTQDATNAPVINRTEKPAMSAERAYARDTEEYVRRLEEKLDLILDRQATPASRHNYPGDVAEFGQALLDQDVPDRLVRPLLVRLSERIKRSPSTDPADIAEAMLVEELASVCSADFNLNPGDRALFIGPAGSGKTSVLGKFAVELLFKRKIKTELSTLDDFRVGAQEEIAGYSEALGASFIDYLHPDKRKKERDETTVALIDCHSNINDQRQYSSLVERARQLRPNVVFLVVSALTRSADLGRLIRRFTPFNPSHLIVTHTDLSESIGGIYTALRESGLRLIATTNSPGSIGVLQSPDPAALARKLATPAKEAVTA